MTKYPRPQRMLFIFKIPRLMCLNCAFSTAVSLCSRLIRSSAMYRSFSVRNLHLSGEEGRMRIARPETRIVTSPSKKKILRQL